MYVRSVRLHVMYACMYVGNVRTLCALYVYCWYACTYVWNACRVGYSCMRLYVMLCAFTMYGMYVMHVCCGRQLCIVVYACMLCMQVRMCVCKVCMYVLCVMHVRYLCVLCVKVRMGCVYLRTYVALCMFCMQAMCDMF